MTEKLDALKTNRGKPAKPRTTKKEKTADEFMTEAWEHTYKGRQKEIEKANKMLLRAWQKTYDNRHKRLA